MIIFPLSFPDNLMETLCPKKLLKEVVALEIYAGTSLFLAVFGGILPSFKDFTNSSVWRTDNLSRKIFS